MEKNYYYDLLKAMQKLVDEGKKQEIEPQVELTMIRDIAAGELLKMGEPFELTYSEENQPEEKKDKSMLGGILGGGSKQTVEKTPDIIVIGAGDEKYAFEIAGLRKLLGKAYDELTGKKAPEMKKEEKPEENNIVYDVNLPEEPKKEEAPEPVQEETQEEKPVKTVDMNNRIPVFGRDRRFPDDKFGKKSRDSFTYGRHLFHIKRSTGDIDVSIYIYPLTTQQQDAKVTDIFAAAESNGAIRSTISRGKQFSVSLEIQDVSFMLRGSWKEGKFVSQANILKGASPEDVTVTEEMIMAEHPTSTAFVRIEANDGEIYIFPAKFDENDQQTGLAPAAMAVVSGGQLNVFGPTSTGSFVLNSGTNLIAYWEGNTFCYQTVQG